MIKLIVSDLDGTLLKDNGDLDNSFFHVIQQLDKLDIIFVACSGRLYPTLKENFKRVKSKMLFAAQNGTHIQYNNGEEIIYENKINKNHIYECLSYFNNLGIESYVCTKEFAVVQKPSLNLIKRLHDGGVPLKQVSYNLSLEENIFKIGIFNNNGFSPNLTNKINNEININLQCVQTGDIWIDIMNKNASKGKSIEIIQHKLKIKQEETMVFGDFYNDISMFKQAYYSFAMKNAPNDVKNTAKFTIGSNNENAVINTISKYLQEEYKWTN